MHQLALLREEYSAFVASTSVLRRAIVIGEPLLGQGEPA